MARAMRERGFTLLELIITMIVLMIFTMVAIPVAKNTIKRQREIELRRALRELRTAIDRYRQIADAGLVNRLRINPSEECMGGTIGTGCYPPDLDVLVEGVELRGTTGRKIKLLREIPVDPMTGKAEWGLRSFQQDPEARSWDGLNVFDVYSLSDGVALDGTRYRDW
ncbi:MAG: type II secretion system protein [Acidobacteria bacterium]|nr:MAG: type II secretion system protein [Acidobacteriota bacterium]